MMIGALVMVQRGGKAKGLCALLLLCGGGKARAK